MTGALRDFVRNGGMLACLCTVLDCNSRHTRTATGSRLFAPLTAVAGQRSLEPLTYFCKRKSLAGAGIRLSEHVQRGHKSVLDAVAIQVHAQHCRQAVKLNGQTERPSPTIINQESALGSRALRLLFPWAHRGSFRGT